MKKQKLAENNTLDYPATSGIMHLGDQKNKPEKIKELILNGKAPEFVLTSEEGVDLHEGMYFFIVQMVFGKWILHSLPFQVLKNMKTLYNFELYKYFSNYESASAFVKQKNKL